MDVAKRRGKATKVASEPQALVDFFGSLDFAGTVGNFVREAMMMERGESSHSDRERTPDRLLCEGHLLGDLKKALSERILNAELDEHLDGERVDGGANRRNGHSKKSVLTNTSKMTYRIDPARPGVARATSIASAMRSSVAWPVTNS